MRESGGKRRMAGVAEKRVALAAKEKIGYTDVKACQLEVIAGQKLPTSRTIYQYHLKIISV